MSQLRRLLPLGCLVALLGGAGALWVHSSPRPGPAPAASAPLLAAPATVHRCTWAAGQQASYAGSHLLDSSFQLSASAMITNMAQGQEIPEQKSKVATTWLLDTEVEEVDAGGFATVAMRFRSFQIKEAEQDRPGTVPGLDTPFLVRLSPQCGIEDFGRRSDQDLDLAFQQQQTVASIQWRHADDGRTRYETHERDSMGEFTARYELSGEGKLQRKRGVFDHLYGSHPQGEAPAGRVQGPGQTITFGPGLWFASIEQDETFLLTLHGKPLATMVLRGKVGPAPAPTLTAPLADAARPGWVWGWLLGSHKPSMGKDKESQVDPELARLSVSQMLAQYTALLGDQNVNKYVDFLARWVRSNPQRLGELLTALRGHRFPAKYGHSAVFLALARASTDEARAALLGITQGHGWDGVDRKRAALALVEAGALPPTLEKTLRDGAAREPEVYASVLGQAIRLQQDKDPAAAQRMRETLSGLLTDARTSDTQTQMLSAVRNAADPSFIPQVQGLTRSSDLDVRIDAYQALGSMPGSVTDSDFTEGLRSESDARARAAMVRAYNSQALLQGGVSPAVLSAAESALTTETNRDVRGELVALVGDAALKKDPGARSAIEGAFRAELSKPDGERDVNLLQQIGKYVGARSKAKG